MKMKKRRNPTKEMKQLKLEHENYEAALISQITRVENDLYALKQEYKKLMEDYQNLLAYVRGE